MDLKINFIKIKDIMDRTLRLTNPYMRGTDVSSVQERVLKQMVYLDQIPKRQFKIFRESLVLQLMGLSGQKLGSS